MNKEFNDILCNQVIDIALVINEIEETPVCVSPNAYAYVSKFVNRMHSVRDFVLNLFKDYNSENIDEVFVTDKMIELMNTLVNYKNSYKIDGISYNTMNSLLDIVKEYFVEINNL